MNTLDTTKGTQPGKFAGIADPFEAACRFHDMSARACACGDVAEAARLTNVAEELDAEFEVQNEAVT